MAVPTRVSDAEISAAVPYNWCSLAAEESGHRDPKDMPRLALKPDSSFFRKIAMGAVGTRTVCGDLAHRGHELVELERGSLDTKLWKDVKRKRVRIPDLVCCRCGIRVESRAKTKAELSVSHSVTAVLSR